MLLFTVVLVPLLLLLDFLDAFIELAWLSWRVHINSTELLYHNKVDVECILVLRDSLLLFALLLLATNLNHCSSLSLSFAVRCLDLAVLKLSLDLLPTLLCKEVLLCFKSNLL